MTWPARRSWRQRTGDGSLGGDGSVVLRPVSAMRGGQVVACSVSLLTAGVLLTRGFIGLAPARPVFVLLGIGLGCSAMMGLAIDHVELRSRAERPDHVLVEEVNRSRRFSHELALLQVACSDATARRLVGQLRSTDWAWRHRGTTYVLLAETGRTGALGLIDRLVAQVPVSAFRMATFPDDAVTVGGLHGALRSVDSVPDPAAAPDAVRVGRRVRLVRPVSTDDDTGPATAEG